MDESTSSSDKRQPIEVNPEQKRATYLKVTNYTTSKDADLSRIPKRKLSVFYRSYDVIAQIVQEKEKETHDFRRTSSSPSVRIERTQENIDSKNDEIDQQTCLHKRAFVNNYRSLIESGKFWSSFSPDHLSEKSSSNNAQVSKVVSLSQTALKLPQVREDTIVDNYATISETSIGKHYKLNNNGNDGLKRYFTARRSLSEGDCERYHRTRRRCKCVKEEESLDEQERLPAFPSFNDTRLQVMGLSCSKDIDSVHRENIPENELERKYIAFSIGVSTDRITLHRRMALSLRQRDQSERNFMNEIQKIQDDIKGLCPLCTDQESIDKVENVRHRLDMIARSAHRVSCAAETLGAVYQEHRISKAIFIADKYLQLLRSRCENLVTDIAEIK
ncbi:Lymphoid-restricted membrane protein [Eufriesea mexicana]|uniref:Lymphoid-restricted membrane protein n=1 Tax=Eufriesea mexicana TaxID=516756 RepID=A0A310SE59_9HYME|nr:Lymphoid-restricted membrane protein [Eufriesea mexicana]